MNALFIFWFQEGLSQKLVLAKLAFCQYLIEIKTMFKQLRVIENYLNQ